MNRLFLELGLGSWKPVLSALVLPPVPFLLLVLVGAALLAAGRRRLGGWTVVIGVALAWLGMSNAGGVALERALLDVPPALGADRIRAIRADPQGKAHRAVVALGVGVEPHAPEYRTSNLAAASLERLRYALWLARQTGVPAGFSGGAGWAQEREPEPRRVAEADVAARIAAQDWRQPLAWIENRSRDTRENAALMLPLLARSGVKQVLLVTHGWHMPRARRAFEEAGRAWGIAIEPAPMGLAPAGWTAPLDWVPSVQGTTRVRNAVHEWLGLVAGA